MQYGMLIMTDLTKEFGSMRASIDTKNKLTSLKTERNKGKSPSDQDYLKSLDQMIRRDYGFDQGETEEVQDMDISTKQPATVSSGV